MVYADICMFCDFHGAVLKYNTYISRMNKTIKYARENNNANVDSNQSHKYSPLIFLLPPRNITVNKCG